MSRNDIDDTLRDMWVTRPRRQRNDKKIAGVAAAIARRYQIDPTLVRVGFVVATIYGGAGIVLYLLCWLLLPEGNDEVSPAEAALGRGRGSMSTALTWVLTIALIATVIHLVLHLPSSIVSIAAIAAGLFLLHRHRGVGTGTPVTTVPGGATIAADQPTVATAREDVTVTMQRPTDQVPGSEPRTEQPTPPAWDPLGVAPFAWDLPEPAQDEPPARPAPPRRRSPVTPVTIGLALVTAGVAAVAAMYDSYLDGPRVVAMVLAVIGTGLVVGSFVRGGRGLIALAIPLAAITWGLTVAPEVNLDGVGNREYAPVRVADVQPRYEHGAGNIQLDLTRLRLSDTETVRTVVELGVGNIEVTVPENADVEATCSAGLGNVQCLELEANGGDARQTVTDFGEDGEGTGGRFVLELINSGGNVELKRG